MQAKQEYRDRDEAQVAVLDALADRADEGMTVFELRTQVEVDIDTLEEALADLKEDDLIEADEADGRTMIVPDNDVIGPVEDEETGGLIDEIRRRLPF